MQYAAVRCTVGGLRLPWDFAQGRLSPRFRPVGMAAASDIALRTKRFRYDGQMPVETANFSGTPDSSLTWASTARNVLGARGIDALSTETSGGTVSTYPLYDTHGNVKAYVKKEASNTWSSLGWKQYNVWGGVRSASGGAGTTSAYCGNLGHVSDQETGLIYMRARYYAPWAGRFVSEDSAMDGSNWYVYCRNMPVGSVDPSGNSVIAAIVGLIKFLLGHALLDEIGTIVNRIAQIERYMAQLDDLMAAANSADNWSAQALEHRKEFIRLSKTLQRFKSYEMIRGKASGILGGISKLFGLMLIMSALLDDIDLAPEGFGSLEAVYG